MCGIAGFVGSPLPKPEASALLASMIGAIAHRLCRLVWKILHDGVTYEERGLAATQARIQRRAAKMIRELRSLGYRVEPVPAPSSNRA